MAGARDRETAPTKAVQQSTDPWALATGGNTDPFYHSTGKRKDVTVDGVLYKNVLDVGTTKPPAAKGIGSISPASGLVITGDERSAAKEAESLAMGVTKEYIASRGGINSMGYYNDTPLNRQLNAEEYKSVTKPDGTIDSAAMWDILNAKSGGTMGSFTGQDLGGGSTGGAGTAAAGGPKTPEQVEADAKRRDAFALLKDIFSQYGLEDLASTIEGYMKDDIGVNQATLLLKQTPAYQTRFAGNQMRLKSGLNVLSEAEYLALENSYSETLKAYGQAGYFGVDRVSRQAKLAAAIGADISAVEFKDRISTVVDRVTNADPAVKSTLRSFYNITDEDLVGYFLNPKKNLPRLKEKVTSAEIGTSAMAQGLSSNVASAEELAKYGVDLETARKGYATIADILPTASKLGDVYKEEGIKYTQGTAEEETFKGLASAQRKRQRLAEKEVASFSGQSGVMRGSLNRASSGLI